jgi:hypothetical protein
MRCRDSCATSISSAAATAVMKIVPCESYPIPRFDRNVAKQEGSRMSFSKRQWLSPSVITST